MITIETKIPPTASLSPDLRGNGRENKMEPLGNYLHAYCNVKSFTAACKGVCLPFAVVVLRSR